MDRRILIIVIVLIILAFVVILAMGFTGNDGKAEMPAWMQGLGFTFDKESGEGSSEGGLEKKLSSPLSVDDLGPASSYCRNQFIEKGLKLSAGQARCEFMIKKSEARLSSTRQMSIRLAQGLSAQVELAQPDQLTVLHQLSPEEPDVSIDIFKEGGTLIFLCEGSGPDAGCQLEFE